MYMPRTEDSVMVGDTPTEVAFGVYTRREIELMSIKKLSNCRTFDEFGHAEDGGLHDPAMGPASDTQTCATCSQPGGVCPGHMAHIELALPVFNPAFFHLTMMLIRGSCVFCHRMSFGSASPAATVLIAQLRVLSMGLTSAVDGFTIALARTQAVSTGGGDIESSLVSGSQIEIEFERVTGVPWPAYDVHKHTRPQTRHVVDMRNNLIKVWCARFRQRHIVQDFQRTRLFRRVNLCQFCGRRAPQLKHNQQTEIVLDFKETKKKAEFSLRRNTKKPDPTEYDESTGEAIFSSADVKREDLMNNLEESLMGEYTMRENMSGVSFADPFAPKTEQTLTPTEMTSGIDAQLALVSARTLTQLVWRGGEARDHMRAVWQHDGALLSIVYPLLSDVHNEMHATRSLCIDRTIASDNNCPLDAFFIDVLAVAPPRFRPLKVMDDQQYEHSRTTALRMVMEDSETVRACALVIKGGLAEDKMKSIQALVDTRIPGKQEMTYKLHVGYRNLQRRVNVLFDMQLDRMEKNKTAGLRQVLEKKEGLFRKHMMGKRVNYACRSVITPDPYIAVDEVGVPIVFARRLTFPEYVNNINLPNLRQMVYRGPDNYPGANYVVYETGQKKMLSGTQLGARQSESARLKPMLAKMMRPTPKAVLRHLMRGDVLIMNRQPTLHKPSMMGHRVRVLPHQTALRLNYAPCKAYNADFDGDEMNGHLVQDFVARAEAHELASAQRNYTVPKDGTPILGLIQDHVVGGVLLSIRDRFFTRADYDHLVLNAFPETQGRLRTLTPALMWPKPMWTGKQVISTVILNILPADMPPLTLLGGRAKVAVKNWQVAGHREPAEDMSESTVVIRRGQLLCGVFDKAQFGAASFSLVHCAHELYGSRIACDLLSAFSRLFTTFLQMRGFTLGVSDILVQPAADARRHTALEQLRRCGPQVIIDTFHLSPATADRHHMQQAMNRAYCPRRGDVSDVKQLDYNMKQATDKYNDVINKAIMPLGLQNVFPENQLQMMILSGAKGTMVNAMQISCMLGQIELEGCRPPLTAAGRTLPSFRQYDESPRAGGFVDQRFLTGVKPQELFFHTMAGREGLIDTAVKTSRSGYLQRCVIKHLEGLTVGYDYTVRDSDASVVQFRYGEDGMDVSRVTFMNPKHFAFMVENAAIVKRRQKQCMNKTSAKLLKHDVKRTCKMFDEMIGVAAKPPVAGAKKYESPFALFATDLMLRMQPDKLQTIFDGRSTADVWQRVAAVRDALVDDWRQLSDKKRDKYMSRAAATHIIDSVATCSTTVELPERLMRSIRAFIGNGGSSERRMRQMLHVKATLARAEPGDCVGLLAAQSIGEPSTQMTLNTFHFAGRGEMNVTLGIPRLREILMAATRSIATPMATVPVADGVTREQADAMAARLDCIALTACLRSVTIEERLTLTRQQRYRRYVIRMNMNKREDREVNARHLTRAHVIGAVEQRYARVLCEALEKRLKITAVQRELQHEKSGRAVEAAATDAEPIAAGRAGGGDDGEQSSDDEGAAAASGENDAATARLRARHDDEANEYEGEDEERPMAGDAQEEDSGQSDDEADTVRDEEDNDSQAGEQKPDLATQINKDRVTNVVRQHGFMVDYQYDTASSKWAQWTVQLPLAKCKLDVPSIIRSSVEQYVVQETKGIRKCGVRAEKNGTLVLQTQGINLHALYAHGQMLQLNKIYTNCIHTVASTYGIEAAARAIKKEVSSVFGVYGIEVDPRHLTLTGDYMTCVGDIRAFNRQYMSTSGSPLQQMSFETTSVFMRQSMLSGFGDHCMSPSSCVVIGRPFACGGTGCFDLRVPTAHLIDGFLRDDERQTGDEMNKTLPATFATDDRPSRRRNTMSIGNASPQKNTRKTFAD